MYFDSGAREHSSETEQSGPTSSCSRKWNCIWSSDPFHVIYFHKMKMRNGNWTEQRRTKSNHEAQAGFAFLQVQKYLGRSMKPLPDSLFHFKQFSIRTARTCQNLPDLLLTFNFKQFSIRSGGYKYEEGAARVATVFRWNTNWAENTDLLSTNWA